MASALGKASTSQNSLIKPMDKAHITTNIGQSVTPNIPITETAVSRPLPIISREVLYTPNGNAVMFSQKTSSEKKTLRVKIKDFFALLAQTPLPKTDKQLLMSGILKLKQKTAVSKQAFTKTSRVVSSKSRVSLASQRKSAQKISLLKNKFRFFLVKQRGIDKA